MSAETPYEQDGPFALDDLVPKEVARATNLVQSIIEDEFNLLIDLDHTGSTGIVRLEKTNSHYDVIEILEAIHMVIPNTISVMFDKPTNSFLISQSRQSLN